MHSASEQHVLWIAGESWDRDGGGQREMAIALTAYARILWVDPPVSLVTPSRLRNGAARTIKPVLTETPDGIDRLTPVALPGLSRPGIRATTFALTRAQIRWAIRKLGLRPTAVVMLYLGSLLGGWGEGVTNIMYGTDDGVAGAELMGVSAAYLRKREREALSKADMTVVLSTELARRWSDMGAKPIVVPNGCWPRPDVASLPPARETDLPRPVVGLVGRLSDRINIDLLEAIADAGQSLLLVGPVDPGWEPERFRRLTSRPSVRYIGPISSAEVPTQMVAIDVGITPYQDSEFNRASFPLKTLEYLSVGTPVVSTSLPAMQWLRDDLEQATPELADRIMMLADNGPAYVKAIQDIAVAGRDAGAGGCIKFADRHSWTRRAEQFAAETGLLLVQEAQL